MIFGAILAGGTGSRMNIPDMPKQFLPLGDRPIIVHTLEKFLTCPRFDYVYVGVHPEWIDHVHSLVEQYAPAEKDRIRIVPGGTDRNSTILNVIHQIEAHFGSSDDHVIVTHDAVRPFVTHSILEKNVDEALRHGAVDTVIPATDTIVTSLDAEVIHDIPIRSQLFQGQTPQSFKINVLKDLYYSLSDEEKNILTDACKICVVRNYPVHMVTGAVLNLKITTMGDYKIAQALVNDLKDVQ